MPENGDKTDETRTGKKGGVKSDERQKRLAEALRANLRRRKAQTRGQNDSAAPDGDVEKDEQKDT